MTAHDEEHSPLLHHYDDDIPYEVPKPSTTNRLRVAIACLFLLTVSEIGGALMTVPRTQIEEGIICRTHHPDVADAFTDPRCKDVDVQSDLSMLQGLESTFSLIPGILTAVPWGIAADKYGRRLVLGLAVLGITLQEGSNIIICHFPYIFPVRLIWASPIFTLIGGGSSVCGAMIFAMASDISTEAQRSTTFFFIGAVALGGDLIAKPLTYFAMEKGIWFSVYLGYGCLIAASLGVIGLPNECDQIEILDDIHEDMEAAPGKTSIFSTVREQIASGVKKFTASGRLLFWENKRLGFIILSMMFTIFGKSSGMFLLQYASKRFGWSYAKTNLFLSVRDVSSLALFTILLPLLSHLFLTKLRLTPLAKDMWLARGSITFVVAGIFAISIASRPAILIVGMVIYALGSGYSMLARSLLSTAAKGHNIGMLFTTVSTLETLSMLIAGPTLAAVFRVGLSLGGVWVGLPFMVAGCALALAGVIIMSVSLGEGNDGRHSRARESCNSARQAETGDAISLHDGYNRTSTPMMYM